jgi:hypothetical protein
MEVGGHRHAPAALPPEKRHNTHCVGGWLGLRTGLDGSGKSRPPPRFDPRIVRPVATRYTDCAIPANKIQAKHKVRSEGADPLILNFGTGWRGVGNSW